MPPATPRAGATVIAVEVIAEHERLPTPIPMPTPAAMSMRIRVSVQMQMRANWMYRVRAAPGTGAAIRCACFSSGKADDADADGQRVAREQADSPVASLLRAIEQHVNHATPLPVSFGAAIPPAHFLTGKRRVLVAEDDDHAEPTPPAATDGASSRQPPGNRSAISPDSTFSFACTGCGRCCQQLAPSVMLDPFDLFLMSRAPSLELDLDLDAGGDQRAPPAPTRALHRQYSLAMRCTVAHFAAPSTSASSPLPPSSPSPPSSPPPPPLAPFVVPTLFLQNKRTNGMCYFAKPASLAPAVALPLTPTSRSVHAQTMASTSESNPASESTTTTSTPKLPPPRWLCRLGRYHQPTPCALYPLGELYSEPLATRSSPSSPAFAIQKGAGASVHAQQQRDFFSLDTELCEGVYVTGAPLRTVRQYQRDNALPDRRRQWEWFRTLASDATQRGCITRELLFEHAQRHGRPQPPASASAVTKRSGFRSSQRPSQTAEAGWSPSNGSAPTCEQLLFSALANIWFNFDACPGLHAARERLPTALDDDLPVSEADVSFLPAPIALEWRVVRTWIQSATEQTLHMHDELLSLSDRRAATIDFTERLLRLGVLPEERDRLGLSL